MTCECGCGKTTPIATRNRRERAQFKGQHLRFITGHNNAGLGRKMTPEQRAAISARRLGKPSTPEQKAKIRAATLGPKNHNWKGDAIKYVSLHGWLRRNFSKTGACEECGGTHTRRTEWANISGEYRRDRDDFRELCTPCHKRFDLARLALL